MVMPDIDLVGVTAVSPTSHRTTDTHHAKERHRQFSHGPGSPPIIGVRRMATTRTLGKGTTTIGRCRTIRGAMPPTSGYRDGADRHTLV